VAGFIEGESDRANQAASARSTSSEIATVLKLEVMCAGDAACCDDCAAGVKVDGVDGCMIPPVGGWIAGIHAGNLIKNYRIRRFD
jgi:hypothetical protein